jgi:hypothetical protein
MFGLMRFKEYWKNKRVLSGDFGQLWQKTGKDSLMGPVKSRAVYESLLGVKQVSGDTAEVGVYKGHTSALIHKVYPDRIHHCYDTFAGIKGATSGIDLHIDGEFSASLDEVRQRVGTMMVEYHVGFFPDTFTQNDRKFSFVHTDTDTYLGTLSSLDRFFSKLNINGKIFIDDYKWVACPGVEKAVSEWSQKTNRADFSIRELPSFQCEIVRLR